jgi:two-component system, LuxR family, response regulator FixJ
MPDNRAVALVDDDPAILDALRFVLELDGYQVAAYDSAPAFLEDQATQPACLITDQHMLGMTGLDLVARLRSQGRNIPALLITGSSSPTIVARASQLGIRVIDKPPNAEELWTFIKAHTSP